MIPVDPDNPVSPVGRNHPVHPVDPVSSLHADALDLLASWTPPDDDQAALRAMFVEHLRRHPRDGALRTCGRSHLTASGLVLDAAGDQVLLTLHRKGNFWVQTGGHIEAGDHSLAAAALREATEESGIAGLRLVGDAPVDLDRHTLSAAFGRCGEHLDVRFAVVAPAGAEPVVSEESRAVSWFGVDALPPEAVADLDRLVTASRSALVAQTPRINTGHRDNQVVSTVGSAGSVGLVGSSSEIDNPAVAETPSR